MRAALQAIWTVLEQIVLALIGQPVAGRRERPKRAPDFRPASPRRAVWEVARQAWLALIGQPDSVPHPKDSDSAASKSKPRS
ncbi:hypothetical protein E7T06_17600 [Deinococcus sp. Arct2-2]|uniref:hypothetical protein n=1 Tax=Deinococcus sp. Arct2-2 TaxID=2568653 RepID=UPI0010A49990|nr:hypothetical protein [Deinococcus sp. Arct2-2]THF68224.1 hypothetical protein E7T06_17600 [Deinococcus sp. Arct2-2]